MKVAFSGIIAVVLLASSAGVSLAQQTPAPAAPATPAAPTAAPAAAKSAMTDDKKAKAKECSTQADAKGLHGKARKEFRSKCKHGG